MPSRPLLTFIARRLAAALAILVVVSALTFELIHLAPGGAEDVLAGQFATPARLEAIRQRYGLDDPLVVQYGRFVRDAVHGDFGASLITREPVLTAIKDRLGVTAPLVLASFLLTVVLGTALGVVSAYRKGRPVDRLMVGVSTAGASSPLFATATILLYVFGVELGLLPTFGEGDGLSERVSHLVLPVATLTLFGVAGMLKITRTRVAEVLEEDYVTFARSRALSSRYVVLSVVLRNAGIMVVTQSAVILLALVGGEILVESVFNLNGLGALFVRAVSQRDVALVQGIILLLTAFIVLVNLLVDLLYFALDPRVRARSLGT